MPRALLSWSGGKDCAWALEKLRGTGVEIVALLTTVDQATNSIAMHAVPCALLEQQARAAGLPLWMAPLPWPCANQDYERIMQTFFDRARAEGIDTVIFGDLFLEDIRAYREKTLEGTGLAPLFPLWRIPTAGLAEEMMQGGLRAVTACVDRKALGSEFAGREFDPAFLADLPAGVDPCGENGEFHSFAYDGPMFREPVPVHVAGVREDNGFAFANLQCPASSH
jgi:uncharacterized protein (TIGR00290 family)